MPAATDQGAHNYARALRAALVRLRGRQRHLQIHGRPSWSTREMENVNFQCICVLYSLREQRRSHPLPSCIHSSTVFGRDKKSVVICSVAWFVQSRSLHRLPFLTSPFPTPTTPLHLPLDTGGESPSNSTLYPASTSFSTPDFAEKPLALAPLPCAILASSFSNPKSNVTSCPRVSTHSTFPPSDDPDVDPATLNLASPSPPFPGPSSFFRHALLLIRRFQNTYSTTTSTTTPPAPPATPTAILVPMGMPPPCSSWVTCPLLRSGSASVLVLGAAGISCATEPSGEGPGVGWMGTPLASREVVPTLTAAATAGGTKTDMPGEAVVAGLEAGATLAALGRARMTPPAPEPVDGLEAAAEGAAAGCCCAGGTKTAAGPPVAGAEAGAAGMSTEGCCCGTTGAGSDVGTTTTGGTTTVGSGVGVSGACGSGVGVASTGAGTVSGMTTTSGSSTTGVDGSGVTTGSGTATTPGVVVPPPPPSRPPRTSPTTGMSGTFNSWAATSAACSPKMRMTSISKIGSRRREED
ncbi:hypothetical protein B0T18DRAFT_185706 [Schizothecium vesticola]|uniref:Uncharacterized protein n=1 Tax=Schizothecium vesticola TaxID=314040 RepID=A0AA40EQ86_9PEZI|nr:hypothetical protein B0T18DRAFT_185706 [Schizothecium vesticola]